MSRLISILKTNNVIKVSPEDTLSKVLSNLSTSHDAAFVFEEDKYLGVINPYHTVIKSSFPSNTKVRHCLFHPPKVYLNTPINKVVEFFINSKVHYLPVFDQSEKFIGIVSARRFLNYFKDSQVFQITIKEFLKNKKKPLYVINEREKVSKAVNILKEKKISKLVVIDSQMKLKGVLSYFDIIHFLISPKDSIQKGDRVGVKINYLNYPVSNFVKTYVLTLTINDSLSKVVNLILEKKIGSVIVVDKNKHPQAIITTKDLLQFFIQPKISENIKFIMRGLSSKNRQIVGGFFNRLSFYLKDNPDIKKANLMIKEEKKGTLFELVFSIFPQKGKIQTFKRVGYSLQDMLFSTLDVVKKFVRKIKEKNDQK